MKRFLVNSALILILILLFGCDQAMDQQVESMKLLKADWSFSKMSLEEGAAEAFKYYLMEDAKLLPAGGDPIAGIETIYEIMKPGYEQIVLRWEPKEANVSNGGDLGYTWGEYTMTFQADTDSQYSLTGKYVNIWRKNESGEWRVIIDIGNMHNPEEEI